MKAHMRRYDRIGDGHSWIDVDGYDGWAKAEGDEHFRQAALLFMETLDPNDVYGVDTSPNTIIIYYRRKDEVPPQVDGRGS